MTLSMAGGASKSDLWTRISAPVSPSDIQWRIDGKPVARNGGYTARFVPYVTAQTVQRRLDQVVPGEWDVTLEQLPSPANAASIAIKARVQILGVIREDVGQGEDHKGAASDAFKRAAMRFGIAAELYDYQPNWVKVDSDSRYPKTLEDPGEAYLRRVSGTKAPSGAVVPDAIRRELGDDPEDGRLLSDEPVATATARTRPAPAPSAAPEDTSCPKCGGPTWDNRLTKRNPKAPDYKCRDRSCDGVIWPPKDGKPAPSAARPGREGVTGPVEGDQRAALEEALDMEPVPPAHTDDDLPF